MQYKCQEVERQYNFHCEVYDYEKVYINIAAQHSYSYHHAFEMSEWHHPL